MFVYIFLLGLIVGSFVNVVIYRVPRGQSVVAGRSMCVYCRVKISWFDLIPIVSFLLLMGKCRNCDRKISWVYPIVELYSGIIFLFAFISNQPDIVTRIFLVFILELLLVLALTDLKNLILPDSILLVVLLGTVAYGIFEHWVGSYSFNIFSLENIAGIVVLFSILFIPWFLSKGAWLGFGDVKLSGLVGLVFGIWGGLIIFYGALIFGMAVALILLASRQANLKTKLPLGTFISFSATVYIFWGSSIQNKIAGLFYSVPLIFK